MMSIIAAMALNRAIGLANRIPWRLPADLQRFKRLTMGHSLIVGRKTYESIGRALPGRTMIVVSRDTGFVAANVTVAHSLAQALARAGDDEVFIGGGADIYRQALPIADRIYLTVIEKAFAGDTFFPDFDITTWRLRESTRDRTADFSYRFETWDRVGERPECA
jgi:dihydrofolate reductase